MSKSPSGPDKFAKGQNRADEGPSESFSALFALAQDEEKAGRRAIARATYEQALQAVRTADDASKVSSIIRWIARTHLMDGDAESALDCLEAALAIAEANGDDAASGNAINLQGNVRWQLGDLDEAERLYLLARSRAIQAGDAKLAAMTAQNLGVLANIRGDYTTAEHQYRASLEDYRSLDLKTDISIALNNLGLLFTKLKRYDEAESVLLEGVQICELDGDVMARTQLDINLAELWVERKEFVRAHGAVRKALAAAAQSGDGSAIGKATKLLGVIARETGSFEEAEQHFIRADAVFMARGELLLQAEIARDRATLARLTGKNRDVLQQLNRAHKLFLQLRAKEDLAEVDAKFTTLEQDFLHVAKRWGEEIEATDRYTQGHCQRVAELGCAIAKQSGMDDAALFWFRIGALLHDVGKIVIPPEVLNKPGKLDDAEWEQMKSHTTAGVEMLKDIEFPWDVRPMVESHHERWDGNGYPHQLKGEEIPLIARILTVADVYDALTSVRSYKRALTHNEAMAILRRDIGTMFDPKVFAWFEEVAVNWPERIAHLSGEPAVARGSDVAIAIASPAELDDLTAIPLRRAFRETLEKVMAARLTTGRPVSMLVIDIDHFKVVNDTFGHLLGDRVLRTVADQIKLNTRPSDYPARYAGDEFVVLLPGTRLEDACIVAERIRAAVAGTVFQETKENSFKVSLSIGVACAPMHGESMESLFGAADAALYAAKRGGRDTVRSAARAGAGRQEVLLQTFVGRESERQRLRDLLANAAAGSPHVVVLSGEAGIGKSTLIKQLGPDVGIRSGAMLMGQCIEANVGVPYGPWADVVQCAHRAGLVAPRAWRELSRIVPELAGEPDAATPASAPAGGSQRALLEEIEEFFKLATAARPLMVVLDDMQWADSSSWDTIEFLLSRLEEQRLLICVTVRPEDLSDAAESRLRRLSRSERCSELNLGRLTRDELTQWLRSTLSGQTPNEVLLEHLVKQSEGNPFFAVQTVRALVDERQLCATDEGWQFQKSDSTQLPRAIGDLLARRIERLSRGRREILALAAVLGREFDPEALVAACDREEADVHDALDEGLASAVLAPSSRERPLLTFSHVQLTRALLHGINPLRLRRMHERIARALETMPGRDPATLAVHFDAAGSSANAYRTAHEAGRQAQSVYAYDSATEFFGMARRNARGTIEIANIEWSLAQVHELAGRFVLAEQHCEHVLTTSRAGATELGVLGAASRMRERLRLQRGAPSDEILKSCTALLETARQHKNPEEEVALLIMLSNLEQRAGQMESSEQLARDAVEAADRSLQTSLQADAVIRLGSVLLTTNPANAVPLYRRALDMYTTLADPHGQLRCHINIGSACDRAGNQPAAEASYVTALEIGRNIHANDLSGVASLNLGVLLHKTGKFQQARTRFDEALQLFTSIGHQPYRLASMYNLAHLARTQRDAGSALELYSACALLAENIKHVDVQIGAIAGVGLAELDLKTAGGASRQRERARALMGSRASWWFQGRELWEALNIRLVASESGPGRGLDLLLEALQRASTHDPYAAVWLGAECADLFLVGDATTVAVRDRLLMQARALGCDPLVTKLLGERLRLVA